MHAGEVALQSDKLLLIIHVITGWTVPAGELMSILTDQFSKKCLESYPNVNPGEMEYAFRNNTTVKDWGKAMNLALIDEVMLPYLERRFELSRIEESAKTPKMIEYEPIEMTDEDLLTATFEVWKMIKKPDLIPESVYHYLVEKGKINLTIEQKKDIRERVYSSDIDEKGIRILCRKIAVSDYFKTLLK